MTVEDLIQELEWIKGDNHAADVPVLLYWDGYPVNGQLQPEYQAGCECCHRPVVYLKVK